MSRESTAEAVVAETKERTERAPTPQARRLWHAADGHIRGSPERDDGRGAAHVCGWFPTCAEAMTFSSNEMVVWSWSLFPLMWPSVLIAFAWGPRVPWPVSVYLPSGFWCPGAWISVIFHCFLPLHALLRPQQGHQCSGDGHHQGLH